MDVEGVRKVGEVERVVVAAPAQPITGPRMLLKITGPRMLLKKSQVDSRKTVDSVPDAGLVRGDGLIGLPGHSSISSILSCTSKHPPASGCRRLSCFRLSSLRTSTHCCSGVSRMSPTRGLLLELSMVVSPYIHMVERGRETCAQRTVLKSIPHVSTTPASGSGAGTNI